MCVFKVFIFFMLMKSCNTCANSPVMWMPEYDSPLWASCRHKRRLDLSMCVIVLGCVVVVVGGVLGERSERRREWTRQAGSIGDLIHRLLLHFKRNLSSWYRR